ncbi:MAG: TAXI family TRAP transporter solute-binding subunit [bacterium]|nr:TAXI family TRAP transporter solute-binding subunit [bacterium]MDT8395349.1 TAXI family TRAP transporter solute-binding subunit [bacterium]
MRRTTMFIVALAAVALAVTGITPVTAVAATKYLTIGTGGVTGVYYPTGGAIARIVNKKKKEYGMRLTVESTGGSVFNINAIMEGDLEFGVVQSDRQYQAFNGSPNSEWDGNPQKNLRALFAIHPESITLVAAVDSGINTVMDLKGKQVNIGNPGSGQRQNSIDALTALGIDYEKDIQAESLKAAEAPGMLQDGRLDAFFYTVGHPSGAFKEATSGTRKVRFVPIELPASFYEKFPYYAPSVVPVVGNYPGAANDADVPSFGVKATFVTSSKVKEKYVYGLVKEIFENFDEFKKLHPAYAVLTKENMLQGLSAPLHKGAEKYFREVGMMK